MAKINSAQYTPGGFIQPTLLVPEMRRDASLRALETLHARLQGLDMHAAMVYDFGQVDASALPALAEQFNVLGDAGWDLADTESKKRALLKEAIALHRLKGTPYAMKRALALLGVHAKISEWWQQSPLGQPYTFAVDIFLGDVAVSNAPMLTPERVAAVTRVVRFWKNTRSGFKARVGVALHKTTRSATVLRPVQMQRVDVWPSTRHSQRPFARTVMVVRPVQRVALLAL